MSDYDRRALPRPNTPSADAPSVNGPPLSDVAGLFGPDSLFWTVWQEVVGLAGGGCSILLQLAHPLVAAGVADFSDFERDPLGRLHRTLDIMLTIVFGDRDQAEAMLRRFHAIHVPVRGHLPAAAGPYAAGRSYTAQDPALKLWVHATLMHTGLLVYERFVRPLTPDERVRFYEESKHLARRMGIPAAIVPTTLDDFSAYMAAMVASNTLAVDDRARAIARSVLNPPIPFILWLGARAVAFVTAGLLPPHLRRAYGLPWSRAHAVALAALCRLSRWLVPHLPSILRLMPQARAAHRRVRRAARRAPTPQSTSPRAL